MSHQEGGSAVILIISFITRPQRGGEGGVGWAFLLAAAEVASSRNEKVICVIDERDERSVREALVGRLYEEFITLVPVRVGPLSRQLSGEARTRFSYLSWAPRARAVTARLAKRNEIRVAHQVTFATASMPHCLPTGKTRTVWGPLAIPANGVAKMGRPKVTVLERLAVAASRLVSRFNTRDVDLLVATNEYTRVALSKHSNRDVALEPNIVVDDVSELAPHQDPFLLCMVGHLIDRKRPWLAIEAMEDARLCDYRLQIIGEGPLRGRLEGLAHAVGVSDRVEFLGALPRKETIKHISQSRVLVHPSAREGAAWVVGEAASVGVPAAVFANSGCDSTVVFSNNGGALAQPGGTRLASSLADAITAVLRNPPPNPSDRWGSDRIPPMLRGWWFGGGGQI